MTFQPVIPAPGLSGWRFLERTYETQFKAFNASPMLERESDYFMEKIGTVQSAADLVSDRRLLAVALGAFGLRDDIDNRFFVQKILEDGTGSDDTLANRLADERYAKLSEAFGFGPGEVRATSDRAAMQALDDMNRVQGFETAVGAQSDDMRIALNAQRDLPDLAGQDMSETAKWFTLMGTPPLRAMFETALGLPSSFGRIDIDQQLGIFRDKVQALTGDGSVSQFQDPEALEKITTVFLARAQINTANAAQSAASNALILLQSARA